MNGIAPAGLCCPYCGESIEVFVDRSAAVQRYVEDCPVCCRPMTLDVRLDRDGLPAVEARREDDV